MKIHIASVHEGKKPFNCELCNYSCSENSRMKKHIASAHEGKKPFKCDFCNYNCSQNSNLKVHIRLVHGGEKTHSALTFIYRMYLQNEM